MSFLSRSLVRPTVAAAASLPTRVLSARSYAYASSADLVEKGKRLIPNGVGRKWDIVIEDGKGLDVTLGDGSKKLDFTAGIGVTNLGHCHPTVTEAVSKQISKVTHVQCAIGMSGPQVELVDRLSQKLPWKENSQVFLWNSGSEAIEAAIKVARCSTGKANIIRMNGAYHGRTYGASALTASKTIYSQAVGPVMPGVFTTPFPFWHSMGRPRDTPEEELVQAALYQLEQVLQSQTAPTDTAAIFVEPLLGEGGYIPTPPSYLEGLRAICDKHSILLVLDEVQSGYGRTGKFWCSEWSGVQGDIIVFAKGLANGFPLSGIAASKDVLGVMPPGSLGGTYAGNVVSCAAANAVLDVFETEDILGNVNARSEQMFSHLNALASSSSTSHLIAEVRGQGLMLAVEFNDPADAICQQHATDKAVPKDIANRVQKKCFDQGLMALTTSIYPVVRFIPALVVSEAQVDQAMAIFKRAVKEVALEG